MGECGSFRRWLVGGVDHVWVGGLCLWWWLVVYEFVLWLCRGVDFLARPTDAQSKPPTTTD